MARLGELTATDAEKFQIMNAQLDNASNEIGQALLPAMVALAEAIANVAKQTGAVIKWFQEHSYVIKAALAPITVMIEANKALINVYKNIGQTIGLIDEDTKKVTNTRKRARGAIEQLGESEKKLTTLTKAEIDKRKKEHEEYVESIRTGLMNLGSFTSSTLGEIGSLYSQHSQNKIESLNQETEARMEILQGEYEAELERAGLAEMTAMEKADKRIEDLKKEIKKSDTLEKKEDLQQQLREAEDAKKKLKIKEEFDKKKEALEKAAAEKERQLKLDTWNKEQKLKIAQTIIETPTAAMRAYSSLAGIPIVGPGLGAAAAAAATALGAAKVALIRQTPPPAEHGMFLPGSAEGTLIQAGERNKAEVMLPLEDEQGQDAIRSAIGGGTNSININIENFYGEGGELSREFINEIDKGLNELQRRGESRVL